MKTIFDKENIIRDMPGVILLSHGALALGCHETALMLMGPQDNFVAFSLEAGDNLATFKDLIKEAIESFCKSFVLVDLFGGSPCNQFLMLSKEIPSDIQAVCGFSLPLVLDVLENREDPDYSMESSINSAVQSIKNVSAFFKRK